MPRVINLSNASECSQNNPYFRVTTHIPERYQYEWIEQILVNELSIFPVTGRTYTLSFEDFPALADVFNMVGLTTNRILRFSDQITLTEAHTSYIQRYSNSYCEIYTDRVEADGGEVLDEMGTCAALGYFTTTSPTSGYRYSFTEGLTVSDISNLIGITGYINLTFTEEMLILDVFVTLRTTSVSNGFLDPVNVVDQFSYSKSSNNDASFSDVLSLNESFVATPARTQTRFVLDQLTLADQFVLAKTVSADVNFLEAVVMSEVFNVFTQNGYSLVFDEAVQIGDAPGVLGINKDNNLSFLDSLLLSESYNSSSDHEKTLFFEDVLRLDEIPALAIVTRGSNLSFSDVLFLTEQFATGTTKGLKYDYQDTLNIVESYASYIQRYSGSRCETYVERVQADGGEVISPYDLCVALSYFSATNPVLGYTLRYDEPLALSDLFALIGVGRQFRVSFLDVIDLLDGYSQTVTWQNKLILEDEMSVADLFSVSKTVNLLLSFIDQVTLEDSYGVQTTITRNRLSFSEAMTLEDEMSYSRSVSRLLSFLDSVDVSSSEGFSAQETSNLKLAFLDPVSVADIASQSQARRLFTSFMDFIQVIESDGLSVKLATGTNLFFTDQIAPAETNERFIQRYEGSPCQSYVLRVEADGGEVIDPYGVCLALGHFADADDPTQGYFLTFQEALSVLTFESVLTNVKRNFTMAFIDGIEPTDESSVTRSRQFTLSFTEQLDLSASI